MTFLPVRALNLSQASIALVHNPATASLEIPGIYLLTLAAIPNAFCLTACPVASNPAFNPASTPTFSEAPLSKPNPILGIKAPVHIVNQLTGSNATSNANHNGAETILETQCLERISPKVDLSVFMF